MENVVYNVLEIMHKPFIQILGIALFEWVCLWIHVSIYLVTAGLAERSLKQDLAGTFYAGRVFYDLFWWELVLKYGIYTKTPTGYLESVIYGDTWGAVSQHLDSSLIRVCLVYNFREWK